MRKPFYPKNPNNVSLSREDARTSLGACPLMKSSVQLVPLRYGLVDNPGLDPSEEIAMPYRLSARSVGFRLLRDGWLYVIDGSTVSLSEYRVREGLVSEMLWQGSAVSADVRDGPINAPSLIFPKTSTLYVTYSEVQWTAKKCRQVLESPGEREHFMQAVDLSKAHCEAGAPHLLTHDILIELVLEKRVDRVHWQQQTFHIRFNPLETGRFPSAGHDESGPKIELLNVDVLALEVNLI